MKVLFLDFDGVLNNFKTHLNDDGEIFSPSSCKNLNKILEKVPGLKIVVSSAWRHRGLEGVRKVLKKNGIDPNKVIGITGDEPGDRGHQIQCWLDRNPGVTNMVILDDDSDMGKLKHKLVKTRSYVGLTSKEADEAVEELKKTC